MLPGTKLHTAGNPGARMSAPADLSYLAMFSSKRHQEQFDVCPAGVLVPGSGTFILVWEAPVRWWRFTRPWKSHPSQRWIKGVQSPGWWREMTVQVFFRKFFTALRKILALYLQDSRGSPGRSPLSQGIYYSCIKRKSSHIQTRNWLSLPPWEHSQRYQKTTMDWLPFSWRIISFVTVF